MVFAIPAGGPKTRPLGMMALVWNGFMGWAVGFILVFSTEMPLVLVFLPFLTLFLLVGLYLAGSWIFMKLTRTNVLLTQNELAVQRILWFHKQIDQTAIDENTDARLIESYSQNDKAAYRIEVDGVEQTAIFGTALSRDDKTWLVESINGFLGRTTKPPIRSSDDKKETELPFDALSPSELSPDSEITATGAGEELTIQSPSTPVGPLATGFSALAWFTVVFWAAIAIWQIAFVRGVTGLIAGVLLLICTLVPIAIVLLLKRGTITVTINPREFVARVHVGVLGKRFHRPVQTAERITLSASGDNPSASSLSATIVQLGSSKLLAAWGTQSTCREVAGLIRHQFQTLEIETTDATHQATEVIP